MIQDTLRSNLNMLACAVVIHKANHLELHLLWNIKGKNNNYLIHGWRQAIEAARHPDRGRRPREEYASKWKEMPLRLARPHVNGSAVVAFRQQTKCEKWGVVEAVYTESGYLEGCGNGLSRSRGSGR